MPRVVWAMQGRQKRWWVVQGLWRMESLHHTASLRPPGNAMASVLPLCCLAGVDSGARPFSWQDGENDAVPGRILLREHEKLPPKGLRSQQRLSRPPWDHLGPTYIV